MMRLPKPLYAFVGFAALLLLAVAAPARAGFVSTTVSISVCGDGQVSGSEFCDDGINSGEYGTTTASRNCIHDCSGFGPYCGDGVLQPLYSEECDDGNGASGDRCSAVCKIENLPVGGGGGGGNYAPGGYTQPKETRVIVQGKAYPNASVHILKDGATVGMVAADPKADFYFSTAGLSPGVSTFGFWAEDSTKLKSIALTTTLTVIQGAVTTISGIFLPPTITVDKRQVDKGGVVNLSGQSVPEVKVTTLVNSNSAITKEVTADKKGNWKLAFDTTPLTGEEFHTAKALFSLGVASNTVKSSYGEAVTFYVGKNKPAVAGEGCKKADLNSDGRVNLVDFSILLFHWNTSGPIGDLNGDAKVNLTDFSILLFCWTG